MLKYFITDSKYSLKEIFKAIERHKPDFVCYRNKEYLNEDEILKFADFAKEYSKIFINFDVTQDREIIQKFDGIHFPSRYIPELSKLKREFSNHLFITSTHSFEEAENSQLSDYITFSPIFNSKGRAGLGVDILEKVPHKQVIALGGIISDKEVKELKNCAGFGSIRYFLN